jgi:hypothetical protein
LASLGGSTALLGEEVLFSDISIFGRGQTELEIRFLAD